jgi:hypothetical protein
MSKDPKARIGARHHNRVKGIPRLTAKTSLNDLQQCLFKLPRNTGSAPAIPALFSITPLSPDGDAASD